MNNIYAIRKYSLAQALSYLGFSFTKYTDNEGTNVYGFVYTDKFREALVHLVAYKKELDLRGYEESPTNEGRA